jgi:hypothetical protein
MAGVRIGSTIALISIICACGSPAAQVKPASSPSTATASPQASPSPPAVQPLVMTPSSDGKQILVESFADPAHPVTLYSLNIKQDNVKFISASEIGYTTNSSPDTPTLGVTTIWRMSLRDMKPVSVARLQGGALDVAWSPDGANVAFIAYPLISDQVSVNRLWLKVGSAGPRSLTPLIELYGRGISSGDEVIVRFSADGRYLLMADTFVANRAPKPVDAAHFQVRSVPDGKLVWVPPAVLKGSWTTMAAWSHLGDRLYYDDPVSGSSASPAGVQWWDPPATVGTLAAGLAWYSPSISFDDRLIAYAVGLSEKPHVAVRDLQSGSVRVLPGTLGAPFFLTNDALIVSHFVPNTMGIGPPYAVGPFFVFDLRTNVETPLPAGFRPIDIWPH